MKFNRIKEAVAVTKSLAISSTINSWDAAPAKVSLLINIRTLFQYIIDIIPIKILFGVVVEQFKKHIY